MKRECTCIVWAKPEMLSNPTKLPALYTMAKEKFNSYCLVLFRRYPSVEKSIAEDKLVLVKETCPRSQTGGVATPPGFAKPVAGCPHQRGAAYQSYLERPTNPNLRSTSIGTEYQKFCGNL